jgi:uncharacterized protein (TIGR03118 family)
MRKLKNLSKVFAVSVVALGIAMEVAADSFYERHNLVSDGFVSADHTDANLVNAWGITFNPTGPVWIANNGSGKSTLYDGDGNIVPLVVQVPGPVTSADPGSPTGIVFNGSTNFAITKGNVTDASAFIFATEQGTIAGWSPKVDFTHAITVVDNSKYNTIYKGLALSAGGNGSLLYATDFHNNKIDVFDSAFKPVAVSGKFVDPFIPQGFAPFGIQAIGGDLYVTYAKQDADKHDDVHGRGLGFVDVFDPNGFLLRRIASRGTLNAPWGLALAPAGFGRFANCLLVGNFGDGRINAYDLVDGQFVGQLRTQDHHPLEVEGLWGLAFGNGFAAQSVNTLYFTAGPDDEAHGVYGQIRAKASVEYDEHRDGENY